MTTAVLSVVEDCIGDYIDGRWDRIDALQQQQPSILMTEARPSVVDLLAWMSPGRVLAIGPLTIPAETAGLASPQQALISSCRGQLLQALAALAMGETSQANAATTALCASLSTLLDDGNPELTRALVVLRLAGPARLLRSLRFFQLGRVHQLAGDLPKRMTMVLGMHRSGTSALSGLLQAAGL